MKCSLENRIEFCAASHIGCVRSRNEDRYFVGTVSPELRSDSNVAMPIDTLNRISSSASEQQVAVAVVADGMGGHGGGDLAAELAIQTFMETLLPDLLHEANNFIDLEPKSKWHPKMLQGIFNAQQTLLRNQLNHFSLSHMGTTLTSALIVEDTLFFSHIGDCRCYLYHRDRLRLLTEDHTMAQLYVKAGLISVEEAKRSSLRHQVYRVLGGQTTEPDPDSGQQELLHGDMVVLCSDGLTEHISEAQICDAIRVGDDCSLCDRLIEQTLHEGATDNVTVVACRLPERV